MLVLGVDPGLARTGVAVVDGTPGRLRLVDAMCIETTPGPDDAARLVVLSNALAAFVAKHRPDAAAVEKLFFAANRRSAMRVSEARGVVLCGIASHRISIAEYTPLQVKEAVAGWGGAEKKQVGRMTATLVGEGAINGPDDVADACAIAVCHHHRAALTALSRQSLVQRLPAMSVGLRAAAQRAQHAAAKRGA